EILVQLAEEAGVPRGIGEVVAELARRGIEPRQFLPELAGAVGRGQQAVGPDRVVSAEDVAGRRECADATEHLPKPVSIVVGRVGLQVRRAMVERDLAAYPRAAEERVLDQVVVLAEAD